jgi:hypothetical protein
MSSIADVPELVVGIAAGAAASTALEPALEIPRQDAWDGARNRILDPGLLARLLAEGGVDLDTAHYYAHRNGMDDDQFAGLVYMAQTVPGAAEAMHLWRLGFISDKDFTHVLVKGGLDQRYVQPIIDSKTEELIGLGDIGIAVVRGILPAPSYVPVPVPQKGDYVPRYPLPIDPSTGRPFDPETLAAKIGYTPEALQVIVGRSGLSLAPVMAAQSLFRSNAAASINNLPAVPGVSTFTGQPYVGPNDYLIAIGEGDLRTEWADAVRETARQINTAHDYAELELRGFLTADQRRALTHQHGMSDFDSDLLYDVLGRAISVHQIVTGKQRLAEWGPDANGIPDDFLHALQRSNLRPEYYDWAYANRYNLPSAFVIRSLLKDGALTETQGETLLKQSGWPPGLAADVATHYAATTTAAADAHVTKAENQLWTTTHKSYVGEMIDDATATTALTAAGVSAAAVPQVITLWGEERSLIRKQLTPAQIAKAVKTGATNPATGVPWTITDAQTALLARGYDANDATTLLEESA